jgi:phosphatidate cytidylyltransferase
MQDTDRVSRGRKSSGELLTRVGSALVLAPLAIGITYLDGWAFVAFWTAAAVLVFREWSNLVIGQARPALHVFGACSVVVAAAMAAWKSAGGGSIAGMVAVLAVIAAGTLGTMVWMRDNRGVWAAAGIAYAGVLGVAPVVLRSDPRYGLQAIIFLFAVVWTTDIVAFFVGRALQGPKLAPAISPNKTWSGAFGGVLGAVGAAACLSSFFALPAFGWVAIMALVLSIVGQTGDLFESALKRRFGAKDSGHLIPGHGGLMDRLDAFIAAVLIATIVGIGRGGLEAPGRGLLVW